ncbi:MAG: hypothetical protein ACFE85_18600, partial [Candidatus Hodarchaeota archaeon]
FELEVSKDIKETLPPTVKELNLLRKKVDPLSIRKLEVVSGKQREELLDEIIQKELAKQNKFPRLLT